MEFRGTVTKHDPPVSHAVSMVGQHFEMDVLYTFDSRGKQTTQVTQETTVHPKGFLKVVFFLMGWMMNRAGCSAAQKELNNLKAILER